MTVETAVGQVRAWAGPAVSKEPATHPFSCIDDGSASGERPGATRKVPRSRLAWALGPLLATLMAIGCTSNPAVGETYTDWDRAGGCSSGETQPWGVSLGGTALGPCMFPGRFVWVTYDALWCGNCARQAGASGAAGRRGPENTVFVVVVGGGRDPHRPATAAELDGRAERLALDRRHVVSEGATQRMLPQHALIGPDGHTWWRHVGELDTDAMLATLDAFQSGSRQPPDFSR